MPKKELYFDNKKYIYDSQNWKLDIYIIAAHTLEFKDNCFAVLHMFQHKFHQTHEHEKKTWRLHVG